MQVNNLSIIMHYLELTTDPNKRWWRDF